MKTTYKTSRDTNGNKTVIISPNNGHRGFSIQTNGNLPRTHRDGVTDDTPAEVLAYVTDHGTDHRRVALGLPAAPSKGKFYIQRRGNGQLETVDQFDTRKEARENLKEYALADRSAVYYISRRPCRDWASK